MLISMRKIVSHYHGQMIIEVIVAVSIFIIIASSSVVTIIGSLNTARLSEEQSRATFLAVEGLEAVKSIRNQAWSNLIIGQHGIATASGVWAFVGTSDIDFSSKYTRVIDVMSVGRDGNGNILSAGGTIDSETKKITSTVSWNFSPTRNNSVVLTLYLTNWQLGKSSSTIPQFCSTFCVGLGYSGGQCRNGKSMCLSNGEIPEHAGNHLCVIQTEGGTCCCQL